MPQSGRLGRVTKPLLVTMGGAWLEQATSTV